MPFSYQDYLNDQQITPIYPVLQTYEDNVSNDANTMGFSREIPGNIGFEQVNILDTMERLNLALRKVC